MRIELDRVLRGRFLLGGVLVTAGLMLPDRADAYVGIGDVWMTPEVEISTSLGPRLNAQGEAVAITDGSVDFDEVFDRAVGRWNEVLNRITLQVSLDVDLNPVDGDQVNQVFFDSKIYGKDFDTGVVAITTSQVFAPPFDAETAEKDIIFNTAFLWDSYRGPLVNDSTDTQLLQDFYRVALHELGHLLGLDHPNEGLSNEFSVKRKKGDLKREGCLVSGWRLGLVRGDLG